MIQGHDGNLYGTTLGGGADGDGILYKISLAGAFTALASFDSTNGIEPDQPLVQDTAGDFWGMTSFGGASSDGTVFKYSSGALTAVVSFDGSDGKTPVEDALVQDSSGNFYGMTSYGGAFTTCGLTQGCGTVFRVTPQGTLTTLHSFSDAEGAEPSAGLAYGTDGNLYGPTDSGGADGFATLFKITTAGTLTVLHSFDDTDGKYPSALVQGTNGIFYGTAGAGGTDNDGTVFSLSVGLGAFVKTVPTYGAVGTSVFILGTDLTGATKVTFDGVSATFTVVSATEITTTVPTGATTGIVKVTTPSGTLSSNVSFFVP